MMDPGLTAASHGLLSIKKEVGRNGVIWWWTNDPKGMGLPNIWTPSRTKPHSKLINDDIHHNMHSGTQQRHFFSARSMFRNRSQSHMHSARTSRLAPQAATTNTRHRPHKVVQQPQPTHYKQSIYVTLRFASTFAFSTAPDEQRLHPKEPEL